MGVVNTANSKGKKSRSFATGGTARLPFGSQGGAPTGSSEPGSTEQGWPQITPGTPPITAAPVIHLWGAGLSCPHF